MQVKFEIAGGHIGEAAKAIFAFGAVGEVVGIVADIHVDASLDRVLAQDFGEGVGELVAAVSIRKLEAVAAKYEACVWVLNRHGWRGGRCRGQVEVIVAAIVKAEFVDRSRGESCLERRLQEVAGGAVGKG